jgi:hypothetical protein
MMRRLLTLGPENEPLWLRLYVHPYANRWAAMVAGDDVPSPDLGTVTGLTCLGATAKEAEGEAKYLGLSEMPEGARRLSERAVKPR